MSCPLPLPTARTAAGKQPHRACATLFIWLQTCSFTWAFSLHRVAWDLGPIHLTDFSPAVFAWSRLQHHASFLLLSIPSSRHPFCDLSCVTLVKSSRNSSFPAPQFHARALVYPLLLPQLVQNRSSNIPPSPSIYPLLRAPNKSPSSLLSRCFACPSNC